MNVKLIFSCCCWCECICTSVKFSIYIKTFSIKLYCCPTCITCTYCLCRGRKISTNSRSYCRCCWCCKSTISSQKCCCVVRWCWNSTSDCSCHRSYTCSSNRRRECLNSCKRIRCICTSYCGTRSRKCHCCRVCTS